MIKKYIFGTVFLLFFMVSSVCVANSYDNNKILAVLPLKVVNDSKLPNKQVLLNKLKNNLPEKKGGIENLFSEYWVEFLALIISIIGLFLGITGFTISNSKKKKSVTKMIHQIDDTFNAFRVKSKRCEAELYRLHDIVDEELKNGKLDESAYQLLINRIDKYLNEVKE